MTIVQRVAVFGCLLLAAGCAASAGDKRRAGQEGDIREVVFRYQFEHSELQQRDLAEAFFIGLDEGDDDPDAAFLARFAGHDPVVLPASDAERSLLGVSHEDTGELGALFFQDDIDWVSDRRVTVEGGWFEGERSAGKSIFHVSLKADGWVVTTRDIKQRS